MAPLRTLVPFLLFPFVRFNEASWVRRLRRNGEMWQGLFAVAPTGVSQPRRRRPVLVSPQIFLSTSKKGKQKNNEKEENNVFLLDGAPTPGV